MMHAVEHEPDRLVMSYVWFNVVGEKLDISFVWMTVCECTCSRHNGRERTFVRLLRGEGVVIAGCRTDERCFFSHQIGF